MADNVNVHASGSMFGDITEEWKKAKTPERVFIVGAVIGVIAIALYLHGKSSSPSQPGASDTSGLSGIPANLQQGTTGGGGGGGTTTGTGGGTTTGGGATNPPVSNPPVSNPPLKFIASPIRVPLKQSTTLTTTCASTTHAPSMLVSMPAPKLTGGARVGGAS